MLFPHFHPLNAITYFDINTYLDALRFSDNHKAKKRQIISDEDYYKLKDFIVNNENSINERLTLGLFLFTGLSKQYIANMRNSQILFKNGIFKLSFIKTGKNGNIPKYVFIPIKVELQLVINEYFLRINDSQMNERVLHVEESYLSSYVSSLSEKITEKNILLKYIRIHLLQKLLRMAIAYGKLVI